MSLLQGCNSGAEPGDNRLTFSRYDIQHCVQAPPTDEGGRISLDLASRWADGEIVYSERDGRFLVADRRSGRWSTTWSYAFAYGDYTPRGIRPKPGRTYLCSETGIEYTSGSDGTLTPTNAAGATIRVLSWNIGCFNNGNSPSTRIDDAGTYEALCEKFSTMIGGESADIVGLCEFLPSLFEERQTADDIFGRYATAAISPETDQYRGKALFANTPIRNLRRLKLGVGTALEGDITIGGQTVRVCVCHPTWWRDAAGGDANWQELKALARHYRYIRNVILMGDFNVARDRREASWKLFTDAGFTLANTEELPTTYNSIRNADAVDNILVKGGRILRFGIIQQTPEGCDPLRPRIEDEALWDAENLSDHFPLVCEIAFP